ncbi:MAG: heme A synthase [Dehalococcoidia bacterium]|nr:heme A synthase [Dehalococcoidia bacterium]
MDFSNARSEVRTHPMSRYQALTAAAAATTYLLIVAGAVVRVSGSGLGCPDWPLCHGGFVPPPDVAAIIEFSHRFIAGADSLLIVGVVALTVASHRNEPRLMAPGILAPLLLAGQIVLGAVTVLLELPPYVVLVHLAFAMAILGLLVWMSVHASGRLAVGAPNLDDGDRFVRWTAVAMALAFVLAMTGALVRASGASWACIGFPACNGELAPFGRNVLTDLQLAHRFMAYATAGVLFVVLVSGWRRRAGYPGLDKASVALGVTLGAQLLIGAAAVSSDLPAVLRGLHVAGAAAVWCSAVAVFSVASRGHRLVEGVAAPRPLFTREAAGS